jgi:hypothetical protein
MTETIYALTDSNGIVIERIVASKEFIDSLPKLINDPNVDTGNLEFSKAYDVTGQNVSLGHKRMSNGTWSKPEPTQEELDAAATIEAERTQRQTEDARITALRAKVGPGKPGLTQADRDELNLIMLSRSVTSV